MLAGLEIMEHPAIQKFLHGVEERQQLKEKASNPGSLEFSGEPSATRTRDTLIKSQVLYQLS